MCAKNLVLCCVATLLYGIKNTFTRFCFSAVKSLLPMLMHARPPNIYSCNTKNVKNKGVIKNYIFMGCKKFCLFGAG